MKSWLSVRMRRTSANNSDREKIFTPFLSITLLREFKIEKISKKNFYANFSEEKQKFSKQIEVQRRTEYPSCRRPVDCKVIAPLVYTQTGSNWTTPAELALQQWDSKHMETETPRPKNLYCRATLLPFLSKDLLHRWGRQNAWQHSNNSSRSYGAADCVWRSNGPFVNSMQGLGS